MKVRYFWLDSWVVLINVKFESCWMDSYIVLKLMYGGFQWFLDGIHAILLWRNIGVILWRITISVGLIYFMGFVLSIVFLLILMLIWLHIFIHVFTCGIVLILKLLMFDIVFILLIIIFVHYCNLRKLTCSWIFFTIISNMIDFSIIQS